MEPQSNKDPPNFQFIHQKPYRRRPALNKTIVIGGKLADIDGTLLQFFQLSDRSFIQSSQVLQKADQYCAKMEAFSDNIIIIFGVSRIIVFNIQQFKVVQEIQIDGFIENCGFRKGFIYTLTTEEDGQMKLINCWRIDQQTGQTIKKYNAVDFSVPDFEDCSDQNIATACIMSVEDLPKIYIYWKKTSNIIEIDPVKGNSQRFMKNKSIVYLCDIDEDSYAQITHQLIHIFSKKEGKQIAKLFSEGQRYVSVYPGNNSSQIYSISNKGIKKWLLKSQAQPQLFAQSQNNQIERLFLAGNGQTVGINTQSKQIIIWQSSNSCNISTFPTEVVRRILKMDETRAFLLLQATATSQQEDQYHVNKYNKMQIYDFSKDIEIARKSVIKFQYVIDVDSAIVCPGDTIRFILNEDTAQGIKKYIFRWSPFIEQKKKQIKKRQIIGAKDFDTIKMFSFDRILALRKSKNEQTFSLFHKDSGPKNQIYLFDFSAKNFGTYEINQAVNDVEMNHNNILYIINPEKLSVYNVDPNKKNRLQKINEIEMTILYAQPFGDYLLVRKDDSFILYDKEFDLIMKEDTEQKNKQFRIFSIDQSSFVLKTDKQASVWNIKDETADSIDGIPFASSRLTEFMSGKLVICDKWIQAYGIKPK